MAITSNFVLRTSRLGLYKLQIGNCKSQILSGPSLREQHRSQDRHHSQRRILAAKSAAQVRLDEGTRSFEAGDYATALRKFEDAYRIFPSPKLWFNIGSSQRLLSRPVEALHAFERQAVDLLSAEVQH